MKNASTKHNFNGKEYILAPSMDHSCEGCAFYRRNDGLPLHCHATTEATMLCTDEKGNEFIWKEGLYEDIRL